MATNHAPEPDPRPRHHSVDGSVVVDGYRCDACRFVTAAPSPRCPVCGGALGDAQFGPHGEVFASTVMRIRIPPRTPPYGLAYVVLDDGPRVLAQAPDDAALPVGGRVRLVPPPADVDPGDLYAVEEDS